MYLNTYNYFKYFCYNKIIRSNKPLIIKSVKSAIHSLLTPLVLTICVIKLKYLKIVFKYYGKYLHLYLIIVLTEVITIVFVFENFIVFVIVFKYYAMYLDPSLIAVKDILPTLHY